jgi:hypothetical protein
MLLKYIQMLLGSLPWVRKLRLTLQTSKGRRMRMMGMRKTGRI